MTYLLPSLMLLALVAGIFTGYPVAFLLAGLSVLFMLLGDIALPSFSLITSRVFGAVLENWILAAIPLFVFMGIMLDKSKVANKLLSELEGLFGGKPGGLGLAVVIIGIIMAASSGIRSEENTSELQSRENLVCRLLLEKKKCNRLPPLPLASLSLLLLSLRLRPSRSTLFPYTTLFRSRCSFSWASCSTSPKWRISC